MLGYKVLSWWESLLEVSTALASATSFPFQRVHAWNGDGGNADYKTVGQLNVDSQKFSHTCILS